MTKKMAIPMLLLLFALPMCGGGSDGNDVAGPSAAGGDAKLRVYLTDKPAEEYLAVNVTIVSIRVHQSGDVGDLDAGWIELPVTAAMPVDLLTLRNGVLYELCQAQLPAGHYQQVRMELSPNTGTVAPFNQSVVTADGVTHALETPSRTIKIIHGFSAGTTQTTDLTLDFEASPSVKQRGNGTYYLTPVIKASSSTAG